MKFGIIVNNLEASQSSFQLISNLNQYLDENPLDDIIVFYENLSMPCLDMRFSLMTVYEAWDFMYPVVATSLSSADKLLRFPSPPLKLFYSYDIEWHRLPQKSYNDLHKIYGNPELLLLTTCPDYAKLIKGCWNRETIIVPDFDIPLLANTIKANYK